MHAVMDVVVTLPGGKAGPLLSQSPVLTTLPSEIPIPSNWKAASRLAALRLSDQADLISIFFCSFCISTVFGSVIVSTPFEKSAAILSRSTLAGSSNERWNDP